MTLIACECQLTGDEFGGVNSRSVPADGRLSQRAVIQMTACLCDETHATAFARDGNQEVVFTLIAVCSGKAMSQDSAFEIAAECLLDVRGC